MEFLEFPSGKRDGLVVWKEIVQMERCRPILEQLDKDLCKIRPAQYEIGKKETVMLPMRDGKKLFTRLIFPKGIERGIVTFQRSCYAFQIPIFEWMACRMAERGFISGYQLCRGIGKSEGEWVPFEHERNDGIDTMEWLQKQNFVSAIGLYGLSYGGYTQWLIADCVPDKVKTMVIAQAGVDRYHSLYCNGCFRHDIYTGWAIENAGVDITESYPECCMIRPFTDMDMRLFHKRLPWFQEWITNTNETDSYWQHGIWANLRKNISKINKPLCLIGGWYDHHLDGMYYAWEHLEKTVKAKSCFLIGPWNHGLQKCVDAYPVLNTEHGGCFAFNEAFMWLDSFFGEKESLKPGVIGYLIGQDRWIAEEEILSRTTKKIYLKNDGRAKFIHNPDKPIIANGAESMLYAPSSLRGSRMQKKEENDFRIISLYSEPFKKVMNIDGVLRLKVKVKSGAEDTAVIVKLMEEFSDGRAYNIRNNASTIAYRNQAKQRRDDYIPGEWMTLVFNMWPVMWSIQKGSRIRIDIQSSHFPEYHVHTNTRGDWAFQKEVKIIWNEVDEKNCALEIPVIYI